mmetsp:Transcript_13874/g.45263  ORF Transcript_13874/g.45263 Transcript_13874/m.45263 type:complete len:114 (+) Transcript_13874:146-487(+)|eukprot:CAMPEP_0118907846 /NCGR_PEP_ID=MMETSP1166-20130328/11118_1 /TAXON_ID=1104430 /ORGANISM="Chrysoreinhardia sp, Strain CCMP3193" /LENGTH=113 /DNA_ID=CAMNT_0006847223 /DNA_START=120 /DNA_END=461 /DNA_ORIENTATION=+
MDALLVASGAACGALSRKAVSDAAAKANLQPWGTCAVNVVGSAFLGSLAAQPPRTSLFFGVGFCGAFTTFSTFALDVVKLASSPPTALAYLVANNALSVGVCYLGFRWAKKPR